MFLVISLLWSIHGKLLFPLFLNTKVMNPLLGRLLSVSALTLQHLFTLNLARSLIARDTCFGRLWLTSKLSANKESFDIVINSKSIRKTRRSVSGLNKLCEFYLY